MNTQAVIAELSRQFRDVRIWERRRDRIVQVGIPMFFRDGDPAEIFVTEGPGGGLLVTDLGAAEKRLGYVMDVEDAQRRKLQKLAERNGLSWRDGAIEMESPPEQLVQSVFALMQVAAQAEAIAHQPTRAERTQEFRGIVFEALSEIFTGFKVVKNPGIDPEDIFHVDFLVETPRKLIIQAISSDIQAERAVGAKLKLEPITREHNARWVACVRDRKGLAKAVRRRLEAGYNVPGESFVEERDLIKKRLLDLGDADRDVA